MRILSYNANSSQTSSDIYLISIFTSFGLISMKFKIYSSSINADIHRSFVLVSFIDRKCRFNRRTVISMKLQLKMLHSSISIGWCKCHLPRTIDNRKCYEENDCRSIRKTKKIKLPEHETNTFSSDCIYLQYTVGIRRHSVFSAW